MKALFLVIFVPAHSALTLLLLGRGFAGSGGAVERILAIAMTSPVLLPCLLYDPDGDRLPRWFQFASIPLNSLVAGLLLLFAFTVVRWLAAGRRE
jgi:hypothetical protein